MRFMVLVEAADSGRVLAAPVPEVFAGERRLRGRREQFANA
jgi:hypothetical protein